MMLASLGSSSFTFAQVNPGLDPVLTLSSTTVTLFSAASSTQSVTVTSNIAWSVSTPPAWLTINQSAGSGNGTITFTAQANIGAAKRVASIIVSAIGVADQIITVTQLPEIPSFKLTSSSQGALSISLQFNASGSFYIDWGDGTQRLQTASISLTNYTSPASPAYIAGNLVKIYGMGITGITINSQSLTSLDVSQCADLTSLDVAYNSLSTLDVSGNTLLNNLSVGFNNLSMMDVSNNPALTSISCISNKINSLDFINNTELI